MIDRSRLGDSSAQRELYKLYVKNMYNCAYRILSHSAEAEDVIQEAFLEAFTRINEFREDASFGAWLKRIVVNKCISIIRKRKIDFVDEQVLDVFSYNVELESDTNDSSKIIELIKMGINELPIGYRLVLSLYLLEGYDHVEIAEILNISESTSKSQYLRAKNKLKDWLVIRNVSLNYENR